MEQEKLQLTTGNNNQNRRKLDRYPTPPEATIALMDFLNLDHDIKIWECACGDGAMLDILRAYGHEVVGTDIIYGEDFLGDVWHDCNAIITNPPFAES